MTRLHVPYTAGHRRGAGGGIDGDGTGGDGIGGEGIGGDGIDKEV